MLKLILSEKILSNYFLLVIISTLVGLIIGKQYILSIFFPILLYTLAYKHGFGKKNLFDLIFLLIISSILFSWMINFYPNKNALIFRFIMAEGAYMAAYFIGKHIGEASISSIFRKSIIPLSVCCILGIYFFFRPPGWYLAQLYNSDSFTGTTLSLEALRLRSIFSSPYVISYMCGLTSIYVFFRIFKSKEMQVKNYIACGLFFITMCLCMMRAPLGCVILSFFIALCYYSIKNGSIKTVMMYFSFIMVIIGILALALQNVDTDMLFFMFEKFDTVVNDGDDFLDMRLNLWDYKYDILGDGAGRHSLVADDYNEYTSIRDSEYIKILVEQGYIGMYLYIVFIAFCLIKCIRYFEFLSFEFCIILFFTVCMIGANPLSTLDKHCFIFWMTAGRIAAFKYNKCKLRNSVNCCKTIE